MTILGRAAVVAGTVAALAVLPGCGGEEASSSHDVDIAVLERQIADVKVELRALDRELNLMREKLDRYDLTALNRELARLDQMVRAADVTLDRREVRRMIQEALTASAE